MLRDARCCGLHERSYPGQDVAYNSKQSKRGTGIDQEWFPSLDEDSHGTDFNKNLSKHKLIDITDCGHQHEADGCL